MRRAIVLLFLLLTLGTASPALAAGQRPPFFSNIGRNFTTGAMFYFKTVGEWFQSALTALGLKERVTIVGKNGACGQKTRCQPDLVCLNVCTDDVCDRYEKRCVVGPSTVSVLLAPSVCSGGNLCADGTTCTRVCPRGDTCSASYRCLPTQVPVGACTQNSECRSVCEKLGFPEIGPSAYVARCTPSGCLCDPIEITPSRERLNCGDADMSALVCPAGTIPACAPTPTCLEAPEYGGYCFADTECAAAACQEGAEAFCGEDRRCKCRRIQALTIPCARAEECSAAGCASDEIAACVSGACACAPAGATTTCNAAADCSNDCPAGFSPACEHAACVCQRTKENAPVSCTRVNECGSVTCPAGYDKACLNAVCACTRTVPQ